MTTDNVRCVKINANLPSILNYKNVTSEIPEWWSDNPVKSEISHNYKTNTSQLIQKNTKCRLSFRRKKNKYQHLLPIIITLIANYHHPQYNYHYTCCFELLYISMCAKQEVPDWIICKFYVHHTTFRLISVSLLNRFSGPVSTWIDRVWVQFPVSAIYLGMWPATEANSAFQPCKVGKWGPASAGKQRQVWLITLVNKLGACR